MNEWPAVHTLRAESRIVSQIAESLPYSGSFQESLKLIRQANAIWIMGIGKSGLVALRGASMMRTVGVPAHALDPVSAMHGDCGVMTRGSLVIALSASGETRELLECLSWRGDVPVIAITRPRSTLDNRAVCRLTVEVDEALPTVSCAAQNAWLDALVIALTPNVEQVLQDTHPSGDIGRRLRDKQTGEPERTEDTYGTGPSEGSRIGGSSEGGTR